MADPTVSLNFAGIHSDSQSTFGLHAAPSSDRRKEFAKTLKDSVIYNREEVVNLLLGDFRPLQPAQPGLSPSQNEQIVEAIVAHLLEKCKKDIETLEEVHQSTPDPSRAHSKKVEDRPEYAMYRPLVRVMIPTFVRLAVLTTVPIGENFR